MNNRVIIVFFSLMLVATACASHKKNIAPPQPKSYEWLSAKVAIDAEGNGQHYDDLTGQIRMRKDSLIWLNVTATMGVEVIRAKVSNDSVWVLNRMDKTYLAEHIDTLSAQLGIPISLPLVQTMLLDNNEGLPPVENQTVVLKNYTFNNLSAKLRYSNIKLDEPTSFPLRITDKMERIRIIKPRNEE